jgi:tetratricopeptide (TPR) repeat protein
VKLQIFFGLTAILPMQPTALWIRGQISAERDWDYESAEKYFLRALNFDPENSEIYNAYSQNLNTQGRSKEALAMAERACELDPVNSWNLSAKYWSLIGIQSYRKSDKVIDEIDNFFPNPIYKKYGHGYTQLLLGNFEKAIKIIEPIKNDLIRKDMSPFTAMLAYAYAAVNRTREALNLIEDLCQDKVSLIGFHMPIAATYGVLGKLDLAIDWLEKAAEARDPGFFFVATTPFYRSLYKEPRFIMLLNRVNLKPNYNFKNSK